MLACWHDMDMTLAVGMMLYAVCHLLWHVVWWCYCNSEALLSMEACLGKGLLQSVLSVLQAALVSLQACCMLASISEQELQAFQLAASGLQEAKTGLQPAIIVEASVLS